MAKNEVTKKSEREMNEELMQRIQALEIQVDRLQSVVRELIDLKLQEYLRGDIK